MVDQKGPERGDGDAKTGKGQSRNIRYLIYTVNAIFIICKIVESGKIISFLYFGKNTES